MKKFLSFILVMAMVLSVSGVAMAEDTYADWTDDTSLPTSGTYKLTTDVTLSSKVTISGKLKLNLNGKTVTINNAGQIFVTSSGALTIEDTGSNGQIIISDTSTASYAIQINGGSLQIDGGTIDKQRANSYAVFINTNGSLTLNGGKIVNSYTKGGRAIYLNAKTTFTMNGGTVESKATNPQGDIPAIESSSNITISGGSIISAGIGITATGKDVTITGGEIDAGGYALQTRYSTVSGDAKLTAGKALLKPYSAPTDGSNGNVITGGTLTAPQLTDGAAGDDKNIEISGGTFKTPAGGVMDDVEDRLAVGVELDGSGNVNPTTHTVTVSADPAGAGSATITGSGTYNYGASATVKATANEGYVFVAWKEDGTQVSTDAEYTFTVTKDCALVAVFEVAKYTVDVEVTPSGAGTITGDGTYNYGDDATVKATANEGYVFVRWTENGNEVSTAAEYTFEVTGDCVLTAEFKVVKYTVEVFASPTDACGTVTGDGSYEEGTTVTVTANAAAGYTFVAWTENGNVVSTDAAYTFAAEADRNLVANFEPIPVVPATYYVRVLATEGGSVNITGGTYNEGTELELVATANEGYVFVRWSKDGQEVTKEATLIVTVSEDAEYTAEFDPEEEPEEPEDPKPTKPDRKDIKVKYEGGNRFSTNKSAVPTSVEIDGVPVSFVGDGRSFTVSCIEPGNHWITVRWHSTSVTTNFTADATVVCMPNGIPKTGDVSVMAYALMAVIAAAGVMRKK